MKRLALAVPAVLLVIIAGFVAIYMAKPLGLWAYVLGAAAAAGALSMVALATREEPPTDAEELKLAKAGLQEQQSQLEKRELELMNRLTVYHEWTEFPEPVDLADAPSDEELSELAEKDRELQVLLAETAEKLFNDILQNRYAADGRVSLPLIRQDALQLAERVALIYNPETDQTLLQTNIEDILRASSRACLQMMTVLDLLPVDIKRQNIDDLYLYVRRAVQAFGVYKKAQPYWGYVNSAYILGRFALGANPLSLGAWWVAGRVSRQAGQHLTKRYLNRQAMTLVHQSIRVLGNEVACVYGAGFRHRDVNWIYAAELTELMSVLPISHRCISHVLREIGTLALRSEYDRVFLYRCIAEGLSARPAQYRAAVVLTPGERQMAAQRLERFANAYGGGASPRKLKKWMAEAESRLDVKLNVSLGADEERVVEPSEIARSLMAFLVEIKEHEPDEAWTRVVAEGLVQLDDQTKANFEQQWAENPAFFFELPDLSPGSDAAKQYLQLLIDLALQQSPRLGQVERVIENAAAYLRFEERELEALITASGSAIVASKIKDRPVSLEADHVAPLLDWLEQAEPVFLITGVQAHWVEKQTPPPGWNRLLLLGENDALSALRIHDGEVQVVWRGRRPDVRLDKGGLLSGAFSVKGGEWLADDAAHPSHMTIRSGRFSRLTASEDYKTLHDWIDQPTDLA